MEWYECPICGSEISENDLLYVNEDDKIVGCRCCIRAVKPALWCREIADEYAGDNADFEYDSEREEALLYD